MPSRIEAITEHDRRDTRTAIVFPGVAWVIPLENKEIGDNSLLIVQCQPDDLKTNFFKHGPVEEFPGVEDIKTFSEICSGEEPQFEVTNREKRITREFNDDVLGSFRLVVRHHAIMVPN